jgi:hypothetical protein
VPRLLIAIESRPDGSVDFHQADRVCRGKSG